MLLDRNPRAAEEESVDDRKGHRNRRHRDRQGRRNHPSALMSTLIRKRASASRPSRNWRGGDVLIIIIAAVVVVMSFVLPAEARTKKQKRPAAAQTQQQTPSLDGRTLGRMRTCGFDYLQYDGLGVPYGPYCH